MRHGGAKRLIGLLLLLLLFTFFYWLAAWFVGHTLLALLAPGCILGSGCRPAGPLTGFALIVALYIGGVVAIVRSHCRAPPD